MGPNGPPPQRTQTLNFLIITHIKTYYYKHIKAHYEKQIKNQFFGSLPVFVKINLRGSLRSSVKISTNGSLSEIV